MRRAQAYTNNMLQKGSIGDKVTTTATKINDGAITQYPYVIGNNIQVAKTHGQYYQLALEQDRDINGRSDGTFRRGCVVLSVGIDVFGFTE